jgi:beta-galactosidase
LPPPKPSGRFGSRYLRIGVILACVLAVVAGGVVAARVLAGAVTVGSVGAGGVGATEPAAAAIYTAPVRRQRLDLNSGWKFTRTEVTDGQTPALNDSSWADVTVPHTWNAADGSDGGDNYHRGIGWYRRHLPVAANLAGKTFFLEFAGANQVADVWVNGTHLGRHQGGYSRFRFGATAVIRAGLDNIIAVKVNNAVNQDIAPLSADYTFAGGIYRTVSLWVVDPLQVSLLDHAGPGVYLRQRAVSAGAATVDVTTKIANKSTAGRSVVVRTVVTDAGSAVVADRFSEARTIGEASDVDVVQTVTIPTPRRWNGLADPYQYRATVEIRDTASDQVTDVVTEPLGLRTFSVDADRGFSLNGHPMRLHGVNLHQDRGGVGWAVDDAQRTQDLGLIREIGANAVRMAHYQHDEKDYALADEMGLVVWAEIPLINHITDTPAFTASTEEQVRELIRQNYNHPSIVFWGIGNEQRTEDAATNTLLDRLAGIAGAEDPDRLSTYANCCLSATSAVPGHADTSGYNKYYGWYTGSSDDLGGWLDRLHAAHPSRRLALSEYGAGANIAQHGLNPGKPVHTGASHPEEYQALLHEAAWKQIDARQYLWGSFVWNMFDFASDGRDEGSQPGINDKGMVTRDRAVRKDAFYWYKANWAPTPTLYLTSRRWTQRTDALTEVKVYSNGGSVSATLNGVSLGVVSSADHIFRWTGVTLRPGQNTVTAVASIGGQTHTDTVTWTLDPR